MWKTFLEKIKNLFKKNVVVVPSVSTIAPQDRVIAVVPAPSIILKESPVSEFLPKGTLIESGPGRGGYADGKGGFTKVNPLDGGNPDFDPSKIVLPTDAERALYERYTQGSPEDKAAAGVEIAALIGATEGPVFAAWLAKASGHQ